MSIAFPNSGRALQQSVGASACNRILLAKLAVQAYRCEHNGALPATLDDLTAGAKPYLANVPTDPFSKTGSDILRYNAQTGDVYSVGENGIDDHNAGDDSSDLYQK